MKHSPGLLPFPSPVASGMGSEWNRRAFLQSVAAVFFAGTHRGLAADPAEGFNLGFSLYGMKGVPLENALQICASIGYSHVELALNPGYATEPSAFPAAARKAVTAQLGALGMDVSSLMLNLSLTAEEKAHAQNLSQIESAALLAHELSAHQAPLLETVLGGKPALWDSQKTGMTERLKDWAQCAAKAGVHLALKAHVASAVNTPERLLWLLEQVPSPWLHVAYDYSHFELQGIEMKESMRMLLPRTRFIHVKDSSGDATKFQFLLPGEGRTDYVAYFRLLRQFGYKGPVCVEVSGQIFNKPGYNPEEAARKSHAPLAQAHRKALGNPA